MDWGLFPWAIPLFSLLDFKVQSYLFLCTFFLFLCPSHRSCPDYGSSIHFIFSSKTYLFDKHQIHLLWYYLCLRLFPARKSMVPVMTANHFPTLLSKSGSVSLWYQEREKKSKPHASTFWKKDSSRKKKKIWGHFITALGEIGKAKHLSGLGPITLTSCSVWLLFWNILNQACFSCVHLSNLWAQGLNLQNDHTGVEELVSVSPPWGTRIPGSLGARWMPGSQRL